MILSVITHPNAKQPRIEKDLLGTLHAYVSAQPLEGKANTATIEALAKHFRVKKSAVTILSGHKTKNKRVEIEEI